ncbi:BMA_0021/BMA_0022 family TOMM bacteriocin [Sessilibacter corallicola]|uniref:Uncharacterized protein n=1 Tax=Sessilibacter corallicola TaxID=2904075 RepID=A0ABQ0A869_9GAMM
MIKNSSSPLMQLRLAYLNFLARTWEKEPNECHKALENGGNLLPFFNEQDMGFTVQFPFLEFHVSRTKTENVNHIWTPEFNQYWSGALDYISIPLPQKPEGITPDQLATALTQYYWIFTTPFGPVFNSSGFCNHSSDPHQYESDLDFYFADPSEDLLFFGGVVLRALSMCWDNEEFFDRLVKISNPENEGEENISGDATPMLNAYLGWTNKYNTQIRFTKSDVFEYDKNSKLGWTNVDKTTLGVWYAEPPVAQQPIALAAFNDEGPNYPLSSC